MTLRKLRVENGKTLADTASVLGVGIRAASRYEQGTRRISLEQVLKLVKFYNCSAEEIIIAQLNSCQ